MTSGLADEIKAQDGNPVLRLFGQYYERHLLYILFSILAQLIARLFWLYPPVVLGVAVDALLTNQTPYMLPLLPHAWVPSGNLDQLYFSLFLFGICYVGGTAIYTLGSWARNLSAYRLQHEVRRDTYDATQHLEFGFFENQETGDLMSILNNDVNELEGFIRNNLQQASNALFMVAGVSFYMLLLNWQLALVAFIAPILIAIYNYAYSRYIEPKHEAIREQVGDINSRIENNLSGIDVIKTYNQENFERERLINVSNSYKTKSWDIARTTVLTGQITGVLTNLGFMLVFFIGGYWVIVGPPLFFTGVLTGGTVVTFLMLNRNFSWPLSQITSIVDSYQQMKAASRRILGLLETDQTISQHSGTTNFDTITGRVKYEDVSFSYRTQQKDAISNVSFKAKPGETIGLVGPTGAGKSTLIKLILRFYEPTGGDIYVDNENITEVSVTSLREQIGYVSQDPYLFDGTIRENISYSSNEICDDRIIAAAKQAGAYEFIGDLEDGLDTQVGERGTQLSGGQRQRISIARAIVDDPQILILDEATSHVDHETEAIIQSGLDELMTDRTTFAIAHRLSTVRHADSILVLDDGRITEKGTHDQLLSRNGLYSDLWEVHTGDFEENTPLET